MARKTTNRLLILLAALHCVASVCRAQNPSSSADWTNTCNDKARGCNCRWVNGKKQASCENAGFEEIPEHLSNEIQVLILDHNNLSVLPNGVFKKLGLVNVQKLSLRNCSIERVEKNAFQGLAIVIEIDLSANKIQKLDPQTFRDVEKLRLLHLNDNLQEKLEDGVFHNLTYLQTVNLEDNRIAHIGQKAFHILPVLRNLKLNGNRLSWVKLSVFQELPSLSSLEIKNNPWKCDCYLREFMMWYTHNLYTDPTTCAEPSRLSSRSWKSVGPDEFACMPNIMWAEAETASDNKLEQVVLACKVHGNPRPEVRWTFNGRTIDNKTIGPNSTDRK